MVFVGEVVIKKFYMYSEMVPKKHPNILFTNFFIGSNKNGNSAIFYFFAFQIYFAQDVV